MSVPERILRSWVGDGFAHTFHFVDANGDDYSLVGATVGFRVLSMKGGTALLTLVEADDEMTVTDASGTVEIAIAHDHEDLAALKASLSYAYELDVTFSGGVKLTAPGGPFYRYKEGEGLSATTTDETTVTVNASGEVTRIEMTNLGTSVVAAFPNIVPAAAVAGGTVTFSLSGTLGNVSQVFYQNYMGGLPYDDNAGGAGFSSDGRIVTAAGDGDWSLEHDFATSSTLYRVTAWVTLTTHSRALPYGPIEFTV